MAHLRAELLIEVTTLLTLANENYQETQKSLKSKDLTEEMIDMAEEAEADLHYAAWVFYQVNTANMIARGSYD